MEWLEQISSYFDNLWHGFGPETKAALIGAIATCVAAFLGFGGLIRQIRSQGKLSNEAIAENERRKIKAKMFEDSVAITRELVDNGISLSTELRIMMLQLEVAARAHAANLGYNMPTARFPSLQKKYTEFTDASHRFIFLIENSRIIDPRILVFRTAMSPVLHDTGKIMHSDFVLHVMPSLPTERPDGQLFDYTPPSIEGMMRIKELSERVLSAISDATAYAEDYLIELQNHLLGDLFNTQIAHRKPIDPASKVITLAKFDELEAWFSNNTEWGKEMAQIEAETHERFKTE
jgi:hypothetical protein